MKRSMFKSALLATLFAVGMMSVFTACKDDEKDTVKDTVMFGTPSFAATTLKAGADVTGGKITIPYQKALGSEEYTVKVAVSGTGAAGITVADKSVKLTSGSGNIELAVTGKPTTAGAVTFTLSGIAGLTKNTIDATVTAAPVSFGTPTFAATKIQATVAIEGGKISIPYTGAAGTEQYTISVAATGAGSAGINAVSNVSKTLTAGNGNIELDITGTPTTAGEVTFTISGITALTKNTVTATVTAAPVVELAVGSYFPLGATKDTAKGLVYWVNPNDKTKGKAVSMDDASGLKWSTENIVTGATSTTDGAANTATIKAVSTYSAETYPPVAWCVAKGDGWYLPTNDELAVLRTEWNKDKDGFNAKLTSPITSYDYWSSVEYRDNAVYYTTFGDGSVHATSKSQTCRTRAIIAF